MSIQINKHNFDVAKQGIKTFAENLPANPTIERVEEAVVFGRWVTGEEANRITSQIQRSLISSNENIRKIIREFGEIYKTLEYLDRDYLTGIVASVQAAEAASEATKKISEETQKNTEDIQKNLDGLIKLVNILKDFKPKTEKKLDYLWVQIDAVAKNLNARSNDLDYLRIDVRDLKDSLNKANKKISDAKSEIDVSLKALEKKFLQSNGFIEKLKKQEHLYKIDLLWQSNQNLQSKFEKNSDDFTTFVAQNEKSLGHIKKELTSLSCFRETLESQEHFKEIDSLWNLDQEMRQTIGQIKSDLGNFITKSEMLYAEVKQNLEEFNYFTLKLSKQAHLSDIDKLWNICLKNEEKFAVLELKERKNAFQLKISYGIAIIAIIFSICNFVVS
jgi:hypothetical protein